MAIDADLHNGTIEVHEVKDAGRVRFLRPPLRFEKTPARIHRPPPRLAEKPNRWASISASTT